MDDKGKFVLGFFISLLVTVVMSYTLKPLYLILKAKLFYTDLFWLPGVLMVLGIILLFILSIYMVLGIINVFNQSGRSRRVLRGYKRMSLLNWTVNLLARFWPFLVLALMFMTYFSYDYLMSLVPEKVATQTQEQYGPVVPSYAVPQDSIAPTSLKTTAGQY